VPAVDEIVGRAFTRRLGSWWSEAGAKRLFGDSRSSSARNPILCAAMLLLTSCSAHHIGISGELVFSTADAFIVQNRRNKGVVLKFKKRTIVGIGLNQWPCCWHLP
jgi:hypothetical protein